MRNKTVKLPVSSTSPNSPPSPSHQSSGSHGKQQQIYGFLAPISPGMLFPQGGGAMAMPLPSPNTSPPSGSNGHDLRFAALSPTTLASFSQMNAAIATTSPTGLSHPEGTSGTMPGFAVPFAMTNAPIMAMTSDEINPTSPGQRTVMVNSKQYARILKRRAARAKWDAMQHKLRERGYLYESRHKNAMKRVRGPKGRFLSAAEITALEQGTDPNASAN